MSTFTRAFRLHHSIHHPFSRATPLVRDAPFGRLTRQLHTGRPSPTFTSHRRLWSYALLGTAGSLIIASAHALKDPLDNETEVTYAVHPTYTHDPTKVTLPTRLDTHLGALQLVATGVRAVTFIGIRVYTAGLYIDSRAIQGWKDGTVPFPPLDDTEALVDLLTKHGFASAVVVVPIRSTSLPHLRDGFTRNLQGRLKTLNISQDAAADAALDILKLRPILADGAFPKGNALQLLFDPTNKSIVFSRRDSALANDHVMLGTFESAALSSELLKCYLSNTQPVSPELKTGVVDFIGSLPH